MSIEVGMACRFLWVRTYSGEPTLLPLSEDQAPLAFVMKSTAKAAKDKAIFLI
jgi:hypothetical protein